MHRIRIAALVVALLAAACAGAPPRPASPAAAVALPGSLVLTAQPAGERSPRGPNRRAVIAKAMAENVRVMVYDGAEARRTASGVVIGAEVRGGQPTSYVITNTHVADARGYAKPRYGVVTGAGPQAVERPATLAALGRLPEMDLAVLEVPGVRLPVAELAADAELQLGEELIVVAAPYGKELSISGGMISQVEWDRSGRVPVALKTDAAIGYGASGGGLYSLETGRLLAVVEGYRTAKINFAVGDQPYTFEVPMPGETFAAPTGKLRRFQADHGLSRLLPPEGGAPLAAAP